MVTEDGTIYVEAFNRSQILRITPDGERDVFAAGNGFNGINGLDRGPDGTFYVANFRDGRLLAVDEEGTITELHRFPRELAHVAHLDGSLFVTARTKYVIYRYDLATGEVEIVAGNAEHGDRDGRGAEASFGSPNAITVGPDGALYFNHAEAAGTATVTIRRLSYEPEA